MSRFALRIREFAEKAKDNMEAVVVKTTIDIASRIVERSPVGNPDLWLTLNPSMDIETRKLTRKDAPKGYVGGRFRANWQIGLDAPATGELDAIDADGEPTKTKLAAEIERIGAGHVVHITNNLPYGPRLEYDGHSSQAPQGMVRITVAEFQSIVDQAAKEVKLS